MLLEAKRANCMHFMSKGLIVAMLTQGAEVARWH
jgi:hypothetical protein